MKAFWIDDYSQRERNFRTFEKCVPGSADFIDARKAFARTLRDFRNGKTVPDLVIVDHFLTNSSVKLLDIGSTVGDLIRQKYPSCPIVGVTSADQIKEIELTQASTYDVLKPADDLTAEDYKAFVALAKAFRIISRLKNPDPEVLLNELRPISEEDSDKLLRLYPDPLRHNADGAIATIFWRWCRETLFDHPGLLFDDIFASNFIGLTPVAFRRLASKFKPARYKGVFADAIPPRWWASGLRKLVMELLKSERIAYTWDAGPHLTKNGAEVSKCHVCKLPGAETVGRVDESATARWVPLHLAHSRPHPGFQRGLFREEIRVMK